MADDRYSLRYAAFDKSGLAAPNASPTSNLIISAGDRLPGFNLALENLGLKLGLLTTAVESLTLKLSVQRAFFQTMGAGAKGESANDPKGKAGRGIEPPALLKPAIEMDSAMADLKQAGQFTPRQIAEMAEPTQRIASAPLVAAGGTTAVELVRMQSLAARNGIGSELPNASDRQLALLRFASDAGVTASTFRMSAMDAAEMLLGWRNSMKLSAGKAFDLADATNHLGKISGGAKASDIGTVLQRDGAAATSVGLQPEQAAALTAAILNTGTQQAEAGAALDSFTTALGKGNQVSATEQAAWKRLGLDSKEVASGLRDKDAAPGTVMSVLAALNAQPADKRANLASSLFGTGNEAVLRMAQKLDDVNAAFWQVKAPGQYATSQLGNDGSVKQDALALSNTLQGRLNVFNASNERLSLAAGNAVAPVMDSSLQWLGSLNDGMSELAETSPKATAAIVLVGAALKPLVGALLKAITDELSNRAAKRILEPASAAKAEVGGSVGRSLRGMNTSARSLRFMPGAPVLGAVPLLVEGAVNGDVQMIGAGLGAAGGGWAGASAGATAGATIGTFFGPGIGTAIGGALGAIVGGLAGSWIGGESGSWLGEKLASPVDKLPPADQTTRGLPQAQAATQQNALTANIYINGQDQASAAQLANLVVQQITSQFRLMPNSLAMRSDAALTDGVT
ncbi:phage tail tape measure protein [Pseudomonas sp. SWRI92]|nr:phage tail tape measure protein [Pseudomonas sp. SWRI92]MBC3373880.1 phage tail tape measure protein [Pseudomonas sp. SWRI92]